MGLKLIPVARPLVALLAKNTRNSSVNEIPVYDRQKPS